MSNIYENPDLNYASMRYSKEGERVERIVDIYEGATVDVSPLDKAQIPFVMQRNCYRAATLTLALLCVLLVVGIIFRSKFYFSVFLENEKLRDSYDELQVKFNTLSQDYCSEENYTQGNATGWRRFRCSCYYISTGRRNWMESREDCQSRGADLVKIDNREEQEFVSEMSKHADSWIGLHTIKSYSWLDSSQCNWKWVDGSWAAYRNWKTGMSRCMKAAPTSMAFIDLQGTWSHSTNGTKQWICEKQI